MPQVASHESADAGARLAIRLLQDAAERGELDPWDVDVIAVVDGFLDQLRQRIEVPRQVAAVLDGRGGSYERDLADSSDDENIPAGKNGCSSRIRFANRLC